MSGDVQPRKRKDRKKKKDDLGVEEPRGTAAALGEGDVFMHSHHDHGTGGHWCAKIIFFSLLFVLVGLIGLIILENRGLSELEANAVQSQYSGVLEGWLEDAPEDDHHDEHTLELNHHDDDHDEEGHSEEAGDDEHDDHDEEEHGDDDDDENDDGQDDDDEDTQQDDEEPDEDGSQEQDLEDNDEEEDLPYRTYYHASEAEPDDDEQDNEDGDEDDAHNDFTKKDDVEDNNDNDDDEDDEKDDFTNNDDDEDDEKDDFTNNDDEEDDADNDVTKYDEGEEDEQDAKSTDEVDQGDDEDNDEDDQSLQQDEEDTDGDSNEQNDEDEEDHEEEEEEEDTSLEVEKIEKEAPEDEEPISNELPALPEPDDDGDEDNNQDSVEDDSPAADEANDSDADDANDPDDDFLEDDGDEPPVERITAPAGKPFVEVEEPSTEKPTDTLAEEEEYEKRQEQLRREEAEASSQMWLKLSIGGALLVATHAIIRRATASRDVPRSEEESREATPAIDRRMTLIPEEPSGPVPIRKVSQESSRPEIPDFAKQIPSITRKSPTFEESEEDVEEEEEEEPVVSKVVRTAQAAKEEEKRELYSDDEEADEEDVEEDEPVVQKKVAPAAAKPPKETTPEPEEDVPDDVEIIDDEQIEEEEEPEDEEEISDVDDEELLTRLEAKYGRLPEPERPARRKDGGNSVEDGWPGEPADAYWRRQLDAAEREFNQGAVMAAASRASAAPLTTSGRARWLVAKALDAEAERKRDNALLGRAIAAYFELLKMSDRLSDKKLLEIAERAINRIQFRGTYLSAEPVYRLLIRRFPDEPSHRTNLTVMFLMANRADLAEDVLKETLKRWPNDRLALAQYGFILKTLHNRLEEALDHLQRALEGDTGPATEPRFYYHLGDTLLLLGRFEEAHEVHKRGAAHGHFLSPAQRSLYNVPKLEGRPWWNIEDTPYVKLARDLENNWKAILREGEAAKALYEQEKEGLKERGEWSQLDLFVRGREIDGRCARAPVTCAVVRREIAASGCRRGQIKFSSMRAGTHVRPHVGPTNCRLRLHLGLSNTRNTYIRVHNETRQWETGKVLMFDDSFEHEVWHNGTGARLVLIVDVWHPGLSAAQRRQLPAI